MTNTAHFLDLINRGNLCAGCGACESLTGGMGITISVSHDGYNRPTQIGEVSDETNDQIARICPGLRLNLQTETRSNHPLWGPHITVSEAYSTSPDVRFAASSGGALTAILVNLLESNEVDFVVHNAADPANPLANITVASHTVEGIKDGAGSRYAPSSPLAKLEEYLATGKRFAVVGKPCDIAALRAIERQDERVRTQVPYMLSFFCAGVPSLTGAERVVEKMGATKNAVSAFRYRGNGWPGYATATLNNGTQREMSYFESWGGVLSSHVQFRCKICPDGVGSFADIVCADAWNCDERGYPVFEEEDGKSLVIARTKIGEGLLRKSIEVRALASITSDISVIDAMQPGQVWRKSVVSARLLAQKLMFKPVPTYSGLRLAEAAKYASVKTRIKNFLGTARRILESK